MSLIIKFLKPVVLVTGFFVCFNLSKIKAQSFTHCDSIQGYHSIYRSNYDVTHYNIFVKFDIPTQSIQANNIITFQALSNINIIQIDLDKRLEIDSIIDLESHALLKYTNDCNAYFIHFESIILKNNSKKIQIYYHGKPQIAKNAP